MEVEAAERTKIVVQAVPVVMVVEEMLTLVAVTHPLEEQTQLAVAEVLAV